MPQPPLEALHVRVQTGAAPRRRTLTILFSDLSGSTRLAGRLEAEDYADLIARLSACYHQAVERYGGTVAQISGDGMLAVFGWPEAREGDGRRAVEAALDLHRCVESLGGAAPLRLHSGIHSGLVILQEGDACRGRFELPGHATHIASRLCAEARPGEILVSEATLGPDRHAFAASARRRLALRGAEEPILTLTVTGRCGARSAEPVPFVGRDSELAALGERLRQAAAAASPRCLLVEGPPGVGKTRLAAEFLRRAAGRGRVHRGACDASAEPLRPFLEIVRSMLGIEAAEQARDPAAIAHLVERAAGEDPLILFVDDWHEADDASRKAMALLTALPRGRLFLLATARPDPAGGGVASAGMDLMRLAPFTTAETGAAVARLLPSADPFTVEAIAAASGGNALFIEELCHDMAAGGPRERPGGGTPWLANLVESRVARLRPEAARLVRIAAVIGNNVPGWLLDAIAGRGAEDPVVRSLAEADFLYPAERPGSLRFKHGTTREVIRESVGLRERRALHVAIAEALAARAAASGEEEPVEALAYHYGEAGWDRETADFAERAGDKALAASALDRAQAHYRAALDALDRLPACSETAYRWSRIAQRFGRAGVYDPSRDQLAIFERAIEKALARGDRADFAWAEYWLGYINYGLGEPAAAIRHWRSALDAAIVVRDGRLEVQIRAALGQGMAAACAYDEALPLLDATVAAKSTHRSGKRPPVSIAYALSCKAFALGDMGRFDEAFACFEEARASIRGSGHEIEVSVLNQNSVVWLWHGRAREALPLALEGARIAQRVRSRYSSAMSRSIAAYARWRLSGDPAEIGALTEATHSLDRFGRGQFTSLNHGWLAEAMTALGRDEEARHYAARALLRARKKDRLGEATALRAMALSAAAGGRSDAALRYLRRAEAAASLRRSPHEHALNRLCRDGIAAALRRGPAPTAGIRPAPAGAAPLAGLLPAAGAA